jgi:death-on-curing family protein
MRGNDEEAEKVGNFHSPTLVIHLCQNRPFIDGNERVAAIAMYVFAVANGYELSLDNDELADTVLSLASGKITKRELTDRMRASLQRI